MRDLLLLLLFCCFSMFCNDRNEINGLKPMNHVVLIAESPDPHCAISGPSNLVEFGRHQMLIKSSTKNQHLVKPSRNQRRINVDRVKYTRGRSVLGLLCRKVNDSACRVASHFDSYSRCLPQFDRKTDCFRNKRHVVRHMQQVVGGQVCGVARLLGPVIC